MDANARSLPVPPAKRRAFLLLPALLAAAAASATGWLSGHDLKRHCEAFAADAASSESAACVAFVQAFIARAGAGDGSRDASIGGDSSERISERAARRRGAQRMQDLLAQRNRYCIGDDVEAAAIVGRVSAYLAGLDTSPAGGDSVLAEPAEKAVRRALLDSFPCSPE